MLAEELKCKAEYMTQDEVARSGDQGFFLELVQSTCVCL